jgi:hypothetical protein
MAQWLRTNTATRVTVGPFFNPSDGVTPLTALTVTSCKLTLIVDVNGVPTMVLDTNPTASGGSNDMVHITGDDAGFYDLELAAANVNYLGRAKLSLTDATNHVPVFHEFMIVPAMIYDSIILGTDRLDANMTHIADTAQTALDLGGIIPDSVPADGTRPTLQQAVYMTLQRWIECSASGTILTVKKVDGVTTLFQCTTNDSVNPTSVTRSA